MNKCLQAMLFAGVVFSSPPKILLQANAETVVGESFEPAVRGSTVRDPEGKLWQVVPLPSSPQHVLCMPADFACSRISGGKPVVDVLVSFHSSAQHGLSGVRRAGLRCVVLCVNYPGLSSAYQRPFARDPQLFAASLQESLAVLRSRAGFSDQVEWGNLAICSFSAGFGAVRELLKSPAYFDRVDGLLLLDSLYCGYVGDGTAGVQRGVVHPGLMRDFLRFAQASAQGRKVMVVTHCSGPTPGYASTRETADYLLEHLGLEPQAVSRVVRLPQHGSAGPEQLTLYRQANRKGFSLFGSPGPNEADHGKHLRHMACWLPSLPIEKGIAKEMSPSE